MFFSWDQKWISTIKVLVGVVSAFVLCSLMAEVYGRHRYLKELEGQESLWSTIVYTDQLTPGPFDPLLGTEGEVSKIGLFKENRDIALWYFGKDARVIQKTQFHLNNVGLISRRDNSTQRKSGEFRIVVLGGEQTAATTSKISWPDHLEDFLNADKAFLRNIGRKIVTVFNFGWPDAGFAHYASVWREKAKGLNPDMVVVNVAAHDFDRLRTVPIPTLQGKRLDGHPVEYRIGPGPKDVAWLLIQCTRAPISLRRLHCTHGGSFQFFMPAELAEDHNKVRMIQHRAVKDFLDGTFWWDFRPLGISYLKGKQVDVMAPRTPRIEGASWREKAGAQDEEVTARAHKYLREIFDDHPNVLIIRNVWLHEFYEASPVDGLMGSIMADQKLQVVIMRDRMLADKSETARWFIPYDGSKWSSYGHERYAREVAKVVKERMTGNKECCRQRLG